MVQEVMLMPRGMIAAPPMPQYGMPMNGQMPPPPPMMPPMPPMPPQPQQQQGAPSQPQQADPWAGGINPSLTALLPQQGSAAGYSPASYSPPAPTGWTQPPSASASPLSVPVQSAQPSAPVPATPPSEPIKPTPIVAPGWGWPPATAGIPIDPGALAGVPALPNPPAPPAELQELIPAEATLNPWRRAAAAPESAATPWRPGEESADHPLNPWRQPAAAPRVNAPPTQPHPVPESQAPAALPAYWPKPTDLFAGAPQATPTALAPQIEQPASWAGAPYVPDRLDVQQAEASTDTDQAQPPVSSAPDPTPYYPTLAPAVPLPPPLPEQSQRSASISNGTYSTRAGRYARKIL